MQKITAIVLAGGSGKRMNGTQKKQYLQLDGKPILFYSLKAFQESCVDEIILVTNEPEYCKKEIVEPYRLDKVRKMTRGGKERYHSVYQGLLAAEGSEYVLIHDSARPFVTQEMICASIDAVKIYGACIVGVPAKDTVKVADCEQFASRTLDREFTWQVQTPQTFSYPLIMEAYEKVLKEQPVGITDDAMIIEYGQYARVKLIMGSYANIKITTPEDLLIAEALYKNFKAK